jgi:hypothetical protein
VSLNIARKYVSCARIRRGGGGLPELTIIAVSVLLNFLIASLAFRELEQHSQCFIFFVTYQRG